MSEKKIRVMVVDDSVFSRTLLVDILKGNGFEVVGEADSLESTIDKYKECKPDIVTMDIAMPGADGFECSNAIFLIDPKAKIILVSSMKDDETETEARRIGISGYVQKPVDDQILLNVIEKILAPDELYNELQKNGLETFKEALSQNITSMTKTPVKFECNECISREYSSQGITTVIGITGQYTGTMIMDLSMKSANKIAKAILRRDPKDKDEVLAMSAELANIIAGIACSMVNKKERAFGLRVSPPSLFHGELAQIASPNIDIHGCFAETDFGKIFLSVGFKKGNVLWM